MLETSLYLLAPQVIGTMTADPEILSLSVEVLRIELLAEPLYGAYIVVSGVFRGAGDTLFSSLMTLASMWGVRLPLAAFLASRRGLRGVWLAMCIELCRRGAIFLARLAGPRWQRRGLATDPKPRGPSGLSSAVRGVSDRCPARR